MAEEGPRPRGRKQPDYLCDFSQSMTKSKVQRDPAMVTALINILQWATFGDRGGGCFLYIDPFDVWLVTSVKLYKFISFPSEDCTVAVKHWTTSRVGGINRARPPHLSQGNSSARLLPHAPVQQHAAMLPCVSFNFISIFTLLRTD